MGETQELQLHIIDQETKEAKLPEHEKITCQPPPPGLDYNWWLRMAIYSVFVLAGQSVATLLGRLYYDKGGKSKWMATLVQLAGFPILLPCLFVSPSKNPTIHSESTHSEKPSSLKVASIYISLGLILAADCMLYSIGLLYLPVSTYSLICASQLAFNALFSFFLNSQKFTFFIINSLVLLTLSSTLLVFQSDSSGSTKIPKGKYILGFLCTVGASAGSALMLSITQFCFRKVLKKQTFRVVLDMTIYQNFVATIAILVGLFVSGEWKGLTKEMEGYELGKLSYVMNRVWTAVTWQVFSIGATGLIFEVSSLFANVISTLGLPVVPVFAVVFFHDKMDGVKVVAMLLAMWGFVSYVYQHYLDDCNPKTAKKYDLGNSVASPA